MTTTLTPAATTFVCTCGYRTTVAAESIDHVEQSHIREIVNPFQPGIEYRLADGCSIQRINEEIDRILQDASTPEVDEQVQCVLRRYDDTFFQDLVESRIRPNPQWFLNTQLEEKISSRSTFISSDELAERANAWPPEWAARLPEVLKKTANWKPSVETEPTVEKTYEELITDMIIARFPDGAIAAAAENVEQHAAEGEWSQHGMSQDEWIDEHHEDYPVFPEPEQPGPTWSDDILYGIAGNIIRKASAYCEAHPASMYLDLLVSMGNIFGRGPYFKVNSTKHFTNEFAALVGETATARKGTGADSVKNLLSQIDADWLNKRTMSGFGSAQAIISAIRDSFVQSVRDKKGVNGFKDIVVQGVEDKRLFIREAELSQVFNLANMKDSQVDVILRLGWDGSSLQNIVKGKSADGISQSVGCREPHFSISAATNVPELLKKMPQGADSNGFGNRFLYCYMYRTKKCPNGGPEMDWSKEVVELVDTIGFAQGVKHVGMSKAANAMWIRLYMDMEDHLPSGLIGLMIARRTAHIKRLAMIFALLDKKDQIDSCHLRAAKKLWDYCEDSARYIFTGCSLEQQRILKFVTDHQPVTLTRIREELFQRNKKAEWIKLQTDDLIRNGFLSITDQVIAPGKRRL